MEFEKTKIDEVILCKPNVINDDRGYFVETFREDQLFDFLGHKINFIQDNESKSKKGVLRGAHFQLPPFAQTKLVRVIIGEVLDVAIDIRRNSPTYGKHVSTILNDVNKHQLLIPRGFAHAFLVLSKEAIFSYKVDNYYSKEHDRGVSFNDFGIDWGVDENSLILSKKDLMQPKLKDVKELFEYGVNYYA